MSNYPKKLLLDFIKSLGPEDMIKAAQAIEKSELGEMFAGVVGVKKSEELGSVRKISVKDDPEFQKTAQENQWATRQERGVRSQTCIFEFIKSVYAPWIGNGMTRADLRSVDKPAWRQLHNRLQKDSLPDWLPLPSRADTFIPPSSDVVAREVTMEARKLNRERMRLVRSLEKK